MTMSVVSNAGVKVGAKLAEKASAVSNGLRTYFPLIVVVALVFLFRKTILGWFGLVSKNSVSGTYTYSVPAGATTMSATDAKYLADEIFACLDGMGTYDTRLNTVYLKLVGDVAAFGMVVAAYGKRKLSSGWFWQSQELDMEGALRHDLSSSAYAPWGALFDKLRANSR